MIEPLQLDAGTETWDVWGTYMGGPCRKPGVAGDGADVSAGQQEHIQEHMHGQMFPVARQGSMCRLGSSILLAQHGWHRSAHHQAGHSRPPSA